MAFGADSARIMPSGGLSREDLSDIVEQRRVLEMAKIPEPK